MNYAFASGARRGDLLERNQPQGRRVLSWNGKVIVEADTFYALDIDRAIVRRLLLPGSPQIIGLASVGPARPVALCADGRRRFLLEKDRGRWREQALPAPLRAATGPLMMAADASTLVIVSPGSLFWLRDNRWHTLEWVPFRGKEFRATLPDHLLVVGTTVYSGYDVGEWGGGLRTVDLISGRFRHVRFADTPLDVPVKAVKCAPDGRVWVVEGLAHLTLEMGRVHLFDGKSWSTFVAQDNTRQWKRRGWDLPPCSFDDVAWDGAGNACLLSGSAGVIRHRSRKWKPITPWWPKRDYVSVASLLFHGGTAVVLTSGAGVILWKVGATRFRRVPLKGPTADSRLLDISEGRAVV